ncbi:MAG TPA: hypothetical protein PKC18_12170 [Lacipirellulaceae bacterium]|nr:hypothetical protein [Lacipirellulaceae bacterium]HMP06662.1 hypothetical protein [Lacipirellulaceae bacterium]
MMTILAHVTPNEFPQGLALFAAGWAAGIVSALAAWRLLRSRS